MHHFCFYLIYRSLFIVYVYIIIKINTSQSNIHFFWRIDNLLNSYGYMYVCHLAIRNSSQWRWTTPVVYGYLSYILSKLCLHYKHIIKVIYTLWTYYQSYVCTMSILSKLYLHYGHIIKVIFALGAYYQSYIYTRSI